MDPNVQNAIQQMQANMQAMQEQKTVYDTAYTQFLVAMLEEAIWTEDATNGAGEGGQEVERLRCVQNAIPRMQAAMLGMQAAAAAIDTACAELVTANAVLHEQIVGERRRVMGLQQELQLPTVLEEERDDWIHPHVEREDAVGPGTEDLCMVRATQE